MKCPTCGDGQKQQRLGPAEQLDQVGYRCAACGRLYAIAANDVAEIIIRLNELKATAEALTRKRDRLSEQIAEAEVQIAKARKQLDDASQQTDGEKSKRSPDKAN
jgi:hypothetical protein